MPLIEIGKGGAGLGKAFALALQKRQEAIANRQAEGRVSPIWTWEPLGDVVLVPGAGLPYPPDYPPDIRHIYCRCGVTESEGA